MVGNNIIQNFPITYFDLNNYHTIFGTNIYGTSGKIVRQKPDGVVLDYVAVPQDFIIITQVFNSRGIFDVFEWCTIINYHATWYKVCDCITHPNPHD